MGTVQRAILAGLIMLAAATSARADTWTVYANARFGTFADYPAERFVALPPPENGDGLTFRARDGATLTISGAYNVEGETPASLHASLGSRSEGVSTTYHAAGKDWVVLSGTRGTDVFYEKHLFRGDIIHSVLLVYPHALATTYDPIAARIARSLRAHAVFIDGKCASDCRQK